MWLSPNYLITTHPCHNQENDMSIKELQQFHGNNILWKKLYAKLVFVPKWTYPSIPLFCGRVKFLHCSRSVSLLFVAQDGHVPLCSLLPCLASATSMFFYTCHFSVSTFLPCIISECWPRFLVSFVEASLKQAAINSYYLYSSLSSVTWISDTHSCTHFLLAVVAVVGTFPSDFLIQWSGRNLFWKESESRNRVKVIHKTPIEVIELANFIRWLNRWYTLTYLKYVTKYKSNWQEQLSSENLGWGNGGNRWGNRLTVD